MKMRRRKILLSLLTVILGALLSFSSCKAPEAENDYQAFIQKDYGEVLFILAGLSDSLSAYTPLDNRVFLNLQSLGHHGLSQAIPNDLLLEEGGLYVVCSGQNVVERYDSRSLDWEGECYLKNGFNPMIFCPVGKDLGAVSGFLGDEIVFIDLKNMTKASGFLKVFGPSGTEQNGFGDEYSRGPTGMAFFEDSRGEAYLYVASVRYDLHIPGGTGYFRQAGLSVFKVNTDRRGAVLLREIDLESLSNSGYSPGKGLNPQSLFVLEGKSGRELVLVCTGTNGGGVAAGADDGKVLTLDLDDPAHPGSQFAELREIGGSPAAYRHSMDRKRGILYLSGVGGLTSWDYKNRQVLRGGDTPIISGSDPDQDYYSHVLYRNNRLYVSDFSHDRLNILSVSGAEDGSGNAALEYKLLENPQCGDGPGALVFR